MSPTSDLSASIVIRAHNEARHIGRLLEGIASQTVKNVEIVVVDSGSTDGTLDIVSKYPHKLVHIPPEKFSFGRALNQGAERASNEFLVLASAHTFPVYDDWIESMLAPFSNEKVALTYGCQRGPPTAPFSEQMLFYQWFPAEAREDQEHPFCNNANAAVRRSAWKDQPYDEELTGLEDLDWAKRAVARGHRIRYVPEATVMHVHEESSKQTYRRYFRESLAMSRIYPGNRFTTWDVIRLLPATVAHDYREAARAKRLSREIFDIPRFRGCQMIGTWKGARHRGGISEALKRTFYYPPESAAHARSKTAEHRRNEINYGRE